MQQMTIKAEDLRKCKLFVATPMYGGQCVGLYMKACLDLQSMCIQHGIEIKFSFLFNESLITRARNYLVDEFIRSGYTHLLFIDSDILFDPQDILALIHLNKDVIGGPYPKKSINWRSVYNGAKRIATDKNFDDSKFNPGELEGLTGEYVFNPVPGTQSFNVTEPLEVMEIGTGFMMIKRGVFDKFKAEYPHLNYKPDHVGQANFDGTRYIHAYFDTVIDPDSHRYLSEDYMFCIPASARINTENGLMTMKQLVDSKYKGKVLSSDKNGVLSWNSVVNWSKRSNKTSNKPWVRINTVSDNNRKSKLICTLDHRVAYLDSVLNIKEIQYIESENLVDKYMIRNPQGHENCLYSNEQLSFMIGTLLGDSSIGKNGQVIITHSQEQLVYNELKAKIFNGSLSVRKNRGFGLDKLCNVVYLPVNSQTKELRNLLYVDGKKTVKNIVHMIDEKALAFWIMDDGSYNVGLNLHTENYSDDDIDLLVQHFKNRWNVKASIRIRKVKYNLSDRQYKILTFGMEDSRKIAQIVSPYIIDNMKYKIEKLCHGNNDVFDYDQIERMQISAVKVKSVSVIDNYKSSLYDIEVENNHNFFANGSLVHNCQYWRAIGGQIWLCPWMKTTHVGTYGFQGDIQKIAAINGAL